jgi:triacylglycerol lipase
VATLREVVLMPRDIAPVLPNARRGDDVVVLIHGFLASAGVWRPLRHQIETHTGAHVASFTHTPGMRVERIAKSLARLVDRMNEETGGVRIHIVGHSLGGLVARWYVQELGGHEHVSQTISLASPFGGTPLAKHFPFLVGLDLHPTSPVLERLRGRAEEHGVPHLSVAGTDDRLVPHDAAHAFPGAERLSLGGRGHNTLLYDPAVASIIVRRVRAHSPRVALAT